MKAWILFVLLFIGSGCAYCPQLTHYKCQLFYGDTRDNLIESQGADVESKLETKASLK